MWCTRWYLPLLLLPFPTAPPFFLLVLVFSFTLHARPCLYCIVLLVALFSSSCYWAPAPLDIPSHVLENALPQLLYGPSIPLQTLLDAPRETPDTTPSRVTYTARLERPKRCWCAPHNLFEPYNITRWESRSTVSVIGRRDFWGWLMDEQIQLPPPPKNESAASNATEPDPQPTDTLTALSESGSPSWQSRWATLQERVASYGRSKSSQNGVTTTSEEVVKTPSAPSPVRTPDPSATMTEAPVPEAPTPLPLLRRQYDLRPFGGGVILDFGWERPKGAAGLRQDKLKPLRAERGGHSEL